MTSDARTVADQLGVLLQRRFRVGLHAEVVEGVHEAVDAATYPVVSGIARLGPVSSAALGGAIGVDRSLISRQAARLVAAGLLAQLTDPADGRVTLLTLTPEGRRVVARLRARLSAVIEHRLRDWSGADRHRLAVLLTRMVDDLTTG